MNKRLRTEFAMVWKRNWGKIAPQKITLVKDNIVKLEITGEDQLEQSFPVS